MPDFPPPPTPRIVLEETFTSWNFKGLINLPCGAYEGSEINIHVDEEHDVAFITWLDPDGGTHIGCWKLSDLSLLWYIPEASGVARYEGGCTGSHGAMDCELTNMDIVCSRNKYVANLRDDGKTIDILNHEGLLQTIDLTEYADFYEIALLHFSRTAKYIFAFPLYESYVLVFEGQQ